LMTHFRIGYDLVAWVCMPDHVHMLISPSGKGESVSDIVRKTKEIATKRMKHQFKTNIEWQRGFHDHVLREHELERGAFLGIMKYILDNPVRKEIVDHWKQWPFLGMKTEYETLFV